MPVESLNRIVPAGGQIIVARDGEQEINRLAAENAALRAELEGVKQTHFKMTREYQPYIDKPPFQPAELYAQACSGDEVTVNSWRDTWIKNIRDNFDLFGGFRDRSMCTQYGKYAGGTAIVAGSGPSLKRNACHLKDRPPYVALVSALHNYAFLHDLGVTADYYLTLDAGMVVVDEMSDGGKESDDYYWASTKGKTLVAFVGSQRALFEKWQGEILLFPAPVPDQAVTELMEELEPGWGDFISAGGNVLGGSTYFARAILGAYNIAWVGNDQSFSYDHQFYGWNHDLNGNPGDDTSSLRWPDVYGHMVRTWPSYMNFACWFNFISMQVPGNWYNCTEGGIVGAFKEGNLRSIKQMRLADFLKMVGAHEVLRDTFEGKLQGDQRGLILF